MGLGEMRRGRVDTLYSEQESIRFVVKKTRFVPFLQRVAVSQTRASGSPGRSGELRSSRNCAACQLTPATIRLPRNPGPPVFHKSPDQSPAGPVFSGPIRQAIPPGNSARPRPRACPMIPRPPSNWPSPTTARGTPHLPHHAVPHAAFLTQVAVLTDCRDPGGRVWCCRRADPRFPHINQRVCLCLMAWCEVRFLLDGGVAACRLSR